MSNIYLFLALVSNHNPRARSDPTHQHFGHSLHGHHIQNSYTQTGSFHIINDGIMANSSTVNSGLHHMACSSAMDCESPVTSTTGLALNYHNSRFQSKAWAPITPSNSLTSPPRSLTSPTIYHHSSHHMRLNNVSHTNSNSSNSQHSHHSRTGAVSSGFRSNRHLHNTQHTPSVPSIGKPHQQLHSTPSLQVAAISSSCPSATSTSSQHVSSAIALESLSQLQKSTSMTSPGSSGSSSDFPVPMDTAGVMLPAFIQPPSTFQSMGTMGSFQPLAYSSSGQSLFIGTGFQINSKPNASSATAHGFSQAPHAPHPSLGSPAVTSSTLGQQRQASSLVESVLRRSRQSYNDEETDRDESSPMVHDGQSISRPSHWP